MSAADASKEGKEWLMVFDNVEDVDAFFKCIPQTKGQILITTRYKRLAFRCPGNAYKMELDSFSEDESLDMFEGYCRTYEPSIDRSSEREEIRTFLKELGGLALGIEQIAAYVSYRGESMTMFRKRYQRSSAWIHANNEAGRVPHTLASVWEVHFETIQKTAAAYILSLMCFLSPHSIPVELFEMDDTEREAVPLFRYDEIE